MDIDIYKCLDKIDIKYDLNTDYINELFLLVRNVLKPIHPRYMFKKKNIIKKIYKYFVEKMDIHKDVIRISKLKQPAQRSQEWYDARYNKITASELASVIGTDMSNICEGEKNKIYKKPAFKNSYDLMKTKILQNDEFKGNIYTDWGILFEPIATLIYEHRNKNRILEFGLIEHPEINLFAASPDGITQYNAIMIEIKVPYKRVLSGSVPLNYWMQMQLQMETCNLDRCHFVEVKTEIYTQEEYEVDTYIDSNNMDIMFTQDKMEKGMLLKCILDKKTEYYYPSYDIFRSKNKMNEWVEERMEYYKNMFDSVECVYWRKKEYSCIEINRDKEWFKNTLPKCNEFWQKVMYFKNNKEEFIQLDNIKKEEKQKRRNKQNKQEYEKLNICTLDTDSEEEEEKIEEKKIVNVLEYMENIKDQENNNIKKMENYDSSENENEKTLKIKERNLMDSIEDDLDLFK
jgi:putative phage-type endonuclease